MRNMNSSLPVAAPAATVSDSESAEALLACPFCGSNQTVSMEVDIGRWAVLCSWCDALGPHSRSRQLAVARWNSPIERGVRDSSTGERP